MNRVIGTLVNRKDGFAKVTGQATYTAVSRLRKASKSRTQLRRIPVQHEICQQSLYTAVGRTVLPPAPLQITIV
jgi:CO/xanthine dehydrogenase Mo-binding subunit